MRVWDLPPAELCNKHLVAEHGEIHGVLNVLTKETRGYASHPEVIRWRGKLPALTQRHDAVSAEMTRRGYRHATPIESRPEQGSAVQDVLLHTLAEQRALLRSKTCSCFSISEATEV